MHAYMIPEATAINSSHAQMEMVNYKASYTFCMKQEVSGAPSLVDLLSIDRLVLHMPAPPPPFGPKQSENKKEESMKGH